MFFELLRRTRQKTKTQNQRPKNKPLPFALLRLPPYHLFIMKSNSAAILNILGRVASLRCVVCGKSSIVEGPFKIKHHCSVCHSLYKREEGFFVGAILVSVVATEFAILLICFFALLVLGVQYDRVLMGLFAIAVLFPLAFYHHGWSIWLAIDHLVESLPAHRQPHIR